MSPEEEKALDALFAYHSPNGETIPKYEAINVTAKAFARTVMEQCPKSADRSAAIRQIREARMTANAAIALNGVNI